MSGLEAWLKTRPPSVQALAALAPPDALVEVAGVALLVIGYTENDELILADPALCYEHAKAKRTYLCADHIRNGDVTVIR